MSNTVSWYKQYQCFKGSKSMDKFTNTQDASGRTCASAGVVNCHRLGALYLLWYYKEPRNERAHIHRQKHLSLKYEYTQTMKDEQFVMSKKLKLILCLQTSLTKIHISKVYQGHTDTYKYKSLR